ncbi:hypothetical protein F5887DRAFT_935338 [Amanita rubescens]|nr:hypothetical protein F5887DRAFT_935338 [Amanita rubescens]
MCIPFRFRRSQPRETSTPTAPPPPRAANPSKPESEADQPANKRIPPVVTPTPPPHVEQIPAVPPDLPSQVDKTLAECPRFRIVLIGNSGVGKSSLVRSIFNVDPDKIDIPNNRAGDADIEREYTSPANPRFILHDSKGFEAGSGVNWDMVEKFLKRRLKYDLPGRIHAIWFCIETPRKGGRLLQTGDERLLKLAKELNIPIIAVFTKYDRLVAQFWRQDNQPDKQKRGDDAERNASDSFNLSVKELRAVTDLSIPCVKVSTEPENTQQTLIDLTKETRSTLHEIGDKLWVLWVAAQQVNVRQKVEVSISEGFKKYWRDLGQSSEFEGQILIDCVHRIHDDVLKVWNFNDPTKILSGTDFFTKMIGLVKPLIDDQIDPTRFPTEPVSSFGSTGAAVLPALLENFGFKPPAIQYLYDKYQKYPSTGKFLATYIINLVLILHGVFKLLLQLPDPPRALSSNLVLNVYNDLRKSALDDIDFTTNPEQVIRKQLGPLLD